MLKIDEDFLSQAEVLESHTDICVYFNELAFNVQSNGLMDTISVKEALIQLRYLEYFS